MSIVRKTWERFDIRKLKFRATEFQYRTAQYAAQFHIPRFLALWDMGLGKTPLAIFWASSLMCRYWRLQHKKLKCIVVAAPQLQENFKNTLLKMGFDRKHIATFYRFWSFELANHRQKEFKRACRKQLVIIDEIQRIRTLIGSGKKKEGKENNKTKGSQAQSVIKGCKKARHVFCMTGTLIVNSLSDLINICHLLCGNDDALKAEFDQWFSINALKKNRPLTTEQLAILQKIFHGKLSVVSKAQLIGKHSQQKLPTHTEVCVVLEMNPEYFAAYKRVENNEAEKLMQENKEMDIKGSGAFWSGLRQAANKINSVASQKRLFALEKILYHKARKEKVALTSVFLSRGLELLTRSFPRHNVRYVEITGETKQKERQKLVNKFNTSKHVDVMVMSGAGTTGTSLTDACIQINLESLWNEASRQQTNFRIVRMDSKHQHLIIYNLMMAKPGPEFRNFVQKLQNAIQNKLPGAPHQVIPISDLSLNNNNTMGVDELPSIDLHLFDIQLNKSQCFDPLLKEIPKWGIETTHTNIKLEPLPIRMKSHHKSKRTRK
jgi:hypothetical protein